MTDTGRLVYDVIPPTSAGPENHEAVVLGPSTLPSVKVFEWIDVSEKMPEIEEDVLIYQDVIEECCVAKWDGMEWYANTGSWVSERTITHWMELPDPPSV